MTDNTIKYTVFVIDPETGLLPYPVGSFYADPDASSAELGSCLIRQGFVPKLKLPNNPDQWFVDLETLNIMADYDFIDGYCYGWIE